MNSGSFEIVIYKDKALTQVITELADGFFMNSDQLTPGTMSGITIEP